MSGVGEEKDLQVPLGYPARSHKKWRCPYILPQTTRKSIATYTIFLKKMWSTCVKSKGENYNVWSSLYKDTDSVESLREILKAQKILAYNKV